MPPVPPPWADDTLPPPPPPPRTPTPVDSEPEPDCEPGGPDDSDIADVTVIHDYVRQGGHGEGEAGEDRCEGHPRFLTEEIDRPEA